MIARGFKAPEGLRVASRDPALDEKLHAGIESGECGPIRQCGSVAVLVSDAIAGTGVQGAGRLDQ